MGKFSLKLNLTEKLFPLAHLLKIATEAIGGHFENWMTMTYLACISQKRDESIAKNVLEIHRIFDKHAKYHVTLLYEAKIRMLSAFLWKTTALPRYVRF